MWALRVVIIYPGGDQIAGVGEVAKRGLVEKFVPHSTVETFHETILHGLSRRDVMPFDPVLATPLQDGVRGKFRPVVADNHAGPTAPFDQRRQFPRNTPAGDRRVRDCSQAFARDVINDVQHPEPPPAGELVMNEIQ